MQVRFPKGYFLALFINNAFDIAQVVYVRMRNYSLRNGTTFVSC